MAQDMEALISAAAAKSGIDPKILKAFVQIESGGRPDARTGSYHGLLQLSQPEFAAGGGRNIYDAGENLNVGAAKIAGEVGQFRKQFGREPEAHELYLIHQQGIAGGPAHLNNPGGKAWENMYGTAEGRRKGEGWAKQAIWGNVPDDAKARYPGGVDSMTSGDFVNLWRDKVARISGQAAGGVPFAVAAAPATAGAGPAPVAAGPIGDVLAYLSPTAPAAEAENSMLKSVMGTGGGRALGDADAMNRQALSNLMNMARARA